MFSFCSMADGAHIHEPELDEPDLDTEDFGVGDVYARDIEILDELAELGLALARGLQAKALAAESPDEAARLAAGFERTARCVRHCIALKGRVRKDEADEHRQGRHDIAEATARAIAKRKANVIMYMRRLIVAAPDDTDGGLAPLRLEELRERLDEVLLDESFLDGPIGDVIATLAQALEIPHPETILGTPQARAPRGRRPHPPDRPGSG